MATGTLAAAGLAGAEFLSIYAARGFASPIANDTLKYIWRSDLTARLGLGAILTVPAGTSVNADRPAFPVLAALFHSVLGTSAFRLAFVVSPVAAVLIGLGAAALAVDGVGEPRWSRPVYALAVGASVNVALMSLGYLDNLLVSAVVVACAACALTAVDGRGGSVAAAMLLGGAFSIHWAFAAVFALVLLGLALVLVPESLRGRHREGGLLRSPSARLFGILGGGLAGGSALVLLAPSLPVKPLGGRSVFLQKLPVNVPDYRFFVLGPLAAAGTAFVALPARARRLRGLALLLVWTLSAPAALIALQAGFAVPAHRLIAFALSIPLLAAGAVVGLARAAGRIRWVGGAVGALVVLGGLAGSVLVTHAVWFDRAHPVMDIYPLSTYPATQEMAFAQAATAGAYVQRSAGGRPVVYVIQPEPFGNSLAVGVAGAGIIRDAIPPEQIPSTAFFLGRVEDLLAGRPTTLPANRRFDRVSLRFWAGVQQLGPDPVVLELEAFNPALANPGPAHPITGRVVGPGVLVVRGPRPTAPVPPAVPPARPSNASLALLALGVLIVLAAAGSGWAAALAPGGWGAKASLSPALGVVVLSVAGLLGDRAGLTLGGGGGLAVVTAATALGWTLAFLLGARTGHLRRAAGPTRSSSPTGGCDTAQHETGIPPETDR